MRVLWPAYGCGFDTVAAADEKWDAPIPTSVMPTGVWR